MLIFSLTIPEFGESTEVIYPIALKVHLSTFSFSSSLLQLINSPKVIIEMSKRIFFVFMIIFFGASLLKWLCGRATGF